MSAPTLPVVGLMLGDTTGIGPEQCAKILADKRLRDAARLVVVGVARVLALGMRDAGVTFDLAAYDAPRDVAWDSDAVPLIDLANADPAALTRGRVS
ncbi:MAG TPA: 4-hydroxythreonine-4-phosphate dehydrogenase, partial [Casimicrobiaceae bacterium]|nr:4-hydroxythreonine-4-phosphate dehydrogenase [Casimicrobiaceae bacterium]